MAVTAETTPRWSRRRRLSWARAGRASVPYWLILPVVAALGAILGYPIYSLVRLSLQHYTLFELIAHKGQWIGLDNFRSVLEDAVFWHTLLRTVVFTIANVGLTMVLVTLLALLLVAITVDAALSQVPAELVEAAEIDGARPWRIFRDVTVPILRPVLLILTSLSILWDFGVFTQPYLLIGQAHIHPGNYLMGV